MLLTDLIATIGCTQPPNDAPATGVYTNTMQSTTTLPSTPESILLAISSIVGSKDPSGRQQEQKAKDALIERVQALALSPALSSVISLIGQAESMSGVAQHNIMKVQFLIIDGLRRGIGQHTHAQRQAYKHSNKHRIKLAPSFDMPLADIHADVTAEAQRVVLALLASSSNNGSKDFGAQVPLKLAQVLQLDLPIEPLNEFVTRCLAAHKWESAVGCITMQNLLWREGCTVNLEDMCRFLLSNHKWKFLHDVVKYWHACDVNEANLGVDEVHTDNSKKETAIRLINYALNNCEGREDESAYFIIKTFRMFDQYPTQVLAHRKRTYTKILDSRKPGMWMTMLERDAQESPELVDFVLRLLVSKNDHALASDVVDRFQWKGDPQSVGFNPQTAKKQKVKQDGEHLKMSDDIGITVVNSIETLHTFSSAMGNPRKGAAERPDMVGLDVEWRPQFQKGSKTVASILQIGSRSHVYILDLLALFAADFKSHATTNSTRNHRQPSHTTDTSDRLGDMAEAAISTLFNDGRIGKIGFGWPNDLNVLRQSYPMRECWTMGSGLIDLQVAHVLDTCITQSEEAKMMLVQRPLVRRGLRNVVQTFMGKPLCKSSQMSNWEARPLSKKQLHYAAMDAHSLVLVMDVMFPQMIGQGGVMCLPVETLQLIVSDMRVKTPTAAANKAQKKQNKKHAADVAASRAANASLPSARGTQAASQQTHTQAGNGNGSGGASDTTRIVTTSSGTFPSACVNGNEELQHEVDPLQCPLTHHDVVDHLLQLLYPNQAQRTTEKAASKKDEGVEQLHINHSLNLTQKDDCSHPVPQVHPSLQSPQEIQAQNMQTHEAALALWETSNRDPNDDVANARIVSPVKIQHIHQLVLSNLEGDGDSTMGWECTHRACVLALPMDAVPSGAPSDVVSRVLGCADRKVFKTIAFLYDTHAILKHNNGNLSSLRPATGGGTSDSRRWLPVAVVVAGDADKVSTGHLSQVCAEMLCDADPSFKSPSRAVKLASAEECVRLFGFVPGTISPIGLRPLDGTCLGGITSEPIPVIVDQQLVEELQANGEVYCGAGSVGHVVRFEDVAALVELTNAKVGAVTGGVYSEESLHMSVTDAEEEGGTVRFFVDNGLGKMVKWLRVLGHDAVTLSDVLPPAPVTGNDTGKHEGGEEDEKLFREQVKHNAGRLRRQQVREMMEHAHAQGRTFITSDRQAAASRGPCQRYFVAVTTNSRAQFEQVCQAFDITYDSATFMSRCTACNNGGLEVTTAEKMSMTPGMKPGSVLSDGVPDGVLDQYDRFWVCGNSECKKVYWEGALFEGAHRHFSSVFDFGI